MANDTFESNATKGRKEGQLSSRAYVCTAQCKNVRANCIQIIAYCQAHTAYAYYYNVYAKERSKKEMIDSHCSPPVVVCIREKCISLHILAAPSNCHTPTHTHTHGQVMQFNANGRRPLELSAMRASKAQNFCAWAWQKVTRQLTRNAN